MNGQVAKSGRVVVRKESGKAVPSRAYITDYAEPHDVGLRSVVVSEISPTRSCSDEFRLFVEEN